MKNWFARLLCPVLEWFRASCLNPSRACQSRPSTSLRAVSQSNGDRKGAVAMLPSPPNPSSLTPEQFRRMLEETLAADPGLFLRAGAGPTLARRLLSLLAGTVLPIVGGMPTCTASFLPKFSNSDCNAPTFENSVLRETNGKIGLGVVPSYLLDLQAGAGAQSLLRFFRTGENIFNLSTDANENAILYLDNGSGTNTITLHTAGDSFFNGGNVGIGTTSPESKLNVKGSASFTASGTVAVTADPTNNNNLKVTGSGTSFTSQVRVGDRITITVGGIITKRTVVSITSDTSLTVDAVYHVTGSGLTMTVLPSIFRGDNASGTPQFTACGDGNARFAGFLGLGGTRIHNDDDVGYVVCFFDNEGNPFLNTNNEMRGYNATMRYTRTTADANKPPNGDGWDVIPFVGVVSLENMNLPPTDPNIRGQMKPFQSELYFKAGVSTYNVVKPAQNYVASLFQVDSSCTITQWAAYVVGVPCEKGGAANKVTTGYGVWVKNLDDPAHTLVPGNAAAIKLDGLGTYGRILWTGCGAYCPASGTLEFDATTAVQTKSGVNFNVGGSAGNAICNAGSYRVGGTEVISSGRVGDFSSLKIGGTQIIDSSKVIHGEIAGNLIRQFSQSSRPTLNAGEVAWWHRTTDDYRGMLFFDGGSYYWLASNNAGGGNVQLFGNP